MKYKNKVPKQEKAYFFNFNLHHWNLSWKSKCLFLYIYIYFCFITFCFFSIFVKSHDKFDLRRRKTGSSFYSGRSGNGRIFIPYNDPSSNSGPHSSCFFACFSFNSSSFSFQYWEFVIFPLYFGKITQELYIQLICNMEWGSPVRDIDEAHRCLTKILISVKGFTITRSKGFNTVRKTEML